VNTYSSLKIAPAKSFFRIQSFVNAGI